MKPLDLAVALIIVTFFSFVGFMKAYEVNTDLVRAEAREEAYLDAYGEAFLRARRAEFVKGNLYIDCSKKESIGLTVVILPTAPIQINGDAALKDFNVYQFQGRK